MQLFKADDGSIKEVVESRVITLDEIDSDIARISLHISRMQECRNAFVAMQNGTPTATAPAAPTTSEVPASDQGANRPDVNTQQSIASAPADLAAPTTPTLDANGNVLIAPVQPAIPEVNMAATQQNPLPQPFINS